MQTQTESLDVIVAKVRALLTEIAQANGQRAQKLLALRPREEDYAAVFAAGVAAGARAGYAGLWASPPPWPVKPEQTQLRIGAAYVEDFARDDPRTRPFPGGYK